MLRTQSLFIDARNIRNLPKEDARNILETATATRECFVDGFKAIGSLMFWACDNERYPDNEMRGDMAIIGLLLSRGSEIIDATIEVECITEMYSKE
ncbi:hypothetical protein [Yersinia pekkanenii]|uniref:Uncharacterized protein n=1 Tax=Yersinia pekkanenii TaxID=1288385 RepID=A0ABM9TZK6_9GAMM|nr:hypothetical protein [Yersinia pekkanenii]CRY69594.1 Uncharacterised protein [Yersinia pekkanenii]